MSARSKKRCCISQTLSPCLAVKTTEYRWIQLVLSAVICGTLPKEPVDGEKKEKTRLASSTCCNKDVRENGVVGDLQCAEFVCVLSQVSVGTETRLIQQQKGINDSGFTLRLNESFRFIHRANSKVTSLVACWQLLLPRGKRTNFWFATFAEWAFVVRQDKWSPETCCCNRHIGQEQIPQ